MVNGFDMEERQWRPARGKWDGEEGNTHTRLERQATSRQRDLSSVRRVRGKGNSERESIPATAWHFEGSMCRQSVG